MFKLFMEFCLMVCVFILGMAFGAEVVSSSKDEEARSHTVDMPINRNPNREYQKTEYREHRSPR